MSKIVTMHWHESNKIKFLFKIMNSPVNPLLPTGPTSPLRPGIPGIPEIPGRPVGPGGPALPVKPGHRKRRNNVRLLELSLKTCLF